MFQVQIIGLGIWYLIATPSVCVMGFAPPPELTILVFNRPDFCERVKEDYNEYYSGYTFSCQQRGKS